MIKFEFEDAELQVDLAHISFKQALAIQQFTAMSIGDWQDSLDFKFIEVNGKKVIVNPPPEWITSVAALYWLAMRQSGHDAVITDVDPDIQAFFAAFLAANVIETQRLLEEAKRKKEAPKSPPPHGQKAGETESPTSGTPTTTTPTPQDPKEEASSLTGS